MVLALHQLNFNWFSHKFRYLWVSVTLTHLIVQSNRVKRLIKHIRETYNLSIVLTIVSWQIGCAVMRY